ncbi:hypothetical protein R1flu_011818 [Riccia fluitans]|uniref:Integrase zinc-binding domain-containing protein n=1 Tax=Riccia fluitans TaxID=41844 RepID=A0ABD1Z8V6_9MARC
MKQLHESLWVGHRGIWATFAKLKERYWWKNMYRDVVPFVESCMTCQMYSNIRHRDGLHPTYPLAIHFKWVVDLVTMPIGLWQMRYLVLITADRGELDTKEASEFFQRYGVKLALTTTYYPEGNAKSERGHPPIVKALVKACNGRAKEWPRLLPFALWADRTMHSSVIGYMPAKLMQGQKPIMPVEEQVALERLRVARVKNKERFDAQHKLRPRDIKEGDWVLVYDNSLDNQHSAFRKFSKHWFGPYVVVRVNDNATYVLRELDGTQLRIPITGKRVKIFKRRDGQLDDLNGMDPDGFTWERDSDDEEERDGELPLEEDCDY